MRLRDVYRYSLMAALLALLGAFLIWPIFLTVSSGFTRAGGAVHSRAYVVFDYRGPDDYKLAGVEPDRSRWVMLHVTGDGESKELVEPAAGAAADRTYDVVLRTTPGRAVLIVDGQRKLEAELEVPVRGKVGLAAYGGPAVFDDMLVTYRQGGAATPLGQAVSFDDSVSDRFDIDRTFWRVEDGLLRAVLNKSERQLLIYREAKDLPVETVEVRMSAPYLGPYTADYFADIFRDVTLRAGLLNSLLVAACTTVLSLLIALPLSVLATRYDFRGKAILTALLLVPLVLPPFVGAIGLQAVLGRMGALNTFLGDVGFFAMLADLGLIETLRHWGIVNAQYDCIDFLGGWRFVGVVLVEALHLYPIAYLNIAAAMANLDPTLDEAAQNIGAGRLRRFLRITLPLIMPGIFAGSTIVFIWSFTELGTPLMFNYREMTPVQIFEGLQEVQSSPRPFALVVLMLLVAVLLYLLGRFVLGRRAYEMQSKASVGATTRRLRGFKWLAAVALFVTITGIAVLPHIGVVLYSFCAEGAWYRSIVPTEWTLTHYEAALSHPLAMSSIRNSLLYASAAMGICMVVGVAISYLTVRCKVRGGWLLDSLAMLPLAVPGLVMAFGYVSMSLHWPFREGAVTDSGFWQVLGLTPYPVPLLIIAYAVRRLPYVVRSASAGLEQTSGMLEEAALNLGASTFTALRKVVLPLIAANLIAGGILAFSFAMLEVSDSLVLAQKEEHYPITKAIFEFFNRLGDGPYIASAMGVWGMALLATTLIGASLFMGKRLGAVFRV